jgi:ankyrin repeat protein
MFSNSDSNFYRQTNIIDNFNLFVEAANEAGINRKLLKLNEIGSCNGLVYSYKLYVHQQQREEYVLALMFIASLKSRDQINHLLEQYMAAEKQGKNFIIDINNHLVNFNKLMAMLERIYFGQEIQSLKEIGVLWDKSYTCVCDKSQLEKHLKNMNWDFGQAAFMHLGEHIFYIEKAKTGFYLFEPNRIDASALNPLIKDENSIAEKIIRNCTWMMSNDYLAFTMIFVSYASKSNLFLEHAFVDLGEQELNQYPTIKLLYDEYRQKKMSRLDCALAIQEIFYEIKKPITSMKILEFLDRINKQIREEQKFISHFLSYSKDRVNQTAYKADKSGNFSLLYLATKSNQITLVKNLLSCPGIQVNLTNLKGLTPLYVASNRGHLFIVELLLKHPDIAVNVTTFASGITPLYAASVNGDVSIVELLLTHPDLDPNLAAKNGITPLHAAAIKGNVSIAKLLLACPDTDVNRVDHNGMAPLGMAAQKGRVHIVKLLLTHPYININLTSTSGTSPLHLACAAGYEGIVKLLLTCPEIQIDLKTRLGFTALYTASENGHVSSIELLIHAGATVNTAGLAKVKILMQHAHQNNRHLNFESLLKVKNNNIIPDELPNFSPLHAAIFFGHEEAVKILLANNADIHANTGNLSCLELAEVMAYKNLASLLKEHLLNLSSLSNVSNLEHSSNLSDASKNIVSKKIS